MQSMMFSSFLCSLILHIIVTKFLLIFNISTSMNKVVHAIFFFITQLIRPKMLPALT